MNLKKLQHVKKISSQILIELKRSKDIKIEI